MGLWVQAIGVRGDLPNSFFVGDEDFALPWSEGNGWTWATLPEDWERDLERFASDTASAAAAPVLALCRAGVHQCYGCSVAGRGAAWLAR